MTLTEVIDGLEREVDAACAYWANKGKGGMQVPFHGDFANTPPSGLHRLKWWIRELRAAPTPGPLAPWDLLRCAEGAVSEYFGEDKSGLHDQMKALRVAVEAASPTPGPDARAPEETTSGARGGCTFLDPYGNPCDLPADHSGCIHSGTSADGKFKWWWTPSGSVADGKCPKCGDDIGEQLAIAYDAGAESKDAQAPGEAGHTRGRTAEPAAERGERRSGPRRRRATALLAARAEGPREPEVKP